MTDILSTGNQTIWDEDGSNSVNVTSNQDLQTVSKIWDGTNEVSVTNNKLDVNAEVTSTDVHYVPRTDSFFTDISINTTYTDLLDETDEGKLDEILIYSDTNKLVVKLEVDGVTIYELKTASLKDRLKLEVDNAVGSTIDSYDRKKGFVDRYPVPVHFDTGIKISVKTSSGNGKIKGYLIKWRKKL